MARRRYDIDKGILYPLEKLQKYPFKELEIGDSFFDNTSTPETVRQHVHIANHRLKPKRFSSRKTMEGGVRVWRLK